MCRSHLLRYFCLENVYFFALVVNALVALGQKSQKERTQLCIECECRNTKILRKKKQQAGTGKHRVKLGWNQNSIVTLTHSLISTTYMAPSSVGGSSHKKRERPGLGCVCQHGNILFMNYHKSKVHRSVKMTFSLFFCAFFLNCLF